MKIAFKLPLSFFFFFLQTNNYSQTEKPENLCANLSKIEAIPFKGNEYQSGYSDEEFETIIKHGEKAIPCLIEKITDSTKMNDPRCPKFTNNFTVGDMAYFLLYRIGKFDFVEMLPINVQERYKTTGTFAYHVFVEQKGNRQQLQSTLKEWYSQKENQTKK